MRVILKKTFFLVVLLAGVQSNTYALNVIAAYEKESYIQKETVDQIEALSKPLWDLTFERNSIENIAFRQTGKFLRSEKIKSRDTGIDVSEEVIRLSWLSPDPVSRKHFQEFIDNHDGLNTHFSHKVTIENATDKTLLETNKITRSLDGVVKNSGMNQRYDSLLPGARECRDNLYSFKGRDYRNLIGCSVIKAIEQERIVKTGKSEDFTVEMSLNGESEESSLVLRCDLYELGPISTKKGPGISDFQERLCIGNHNGSPIVYKRETILQLSGKTPTKSTTRLTYLKLDSIVDVTIFNLERSSVCPEPLLIDQKKTRC